MLDCEHMGRPKRTSGKRGPDSERMWRRLTSLFTTHDDWSKTWTSEEMVDYLIKHEARPPSREDAKAYRKRLLEEVQEIVRKTRKHGNHFKTIPMWHLRISVISYPSPSKGLRLFWLGCVQNANGIVTNSFGLKRRIIR